jgi:biotin carboxylase
VPEHVLLLNTGKAEALDELRKVVPAAHVSIVTEPRYVDSYPEGTELHLVDDIADSAEVHPLVARLHAARPVEAVLAPSERSVLPGSRLRELLGLPGLGPDAALLFTDKGAMKSALSSAGLRVAEHRRVDSAAALQQAVAELSGPLVVKPVFGTGSMGVTRVEVAERPRLAAIVTASSEQPWLVEQLVAFDEELHCDAVVSGGEVVFASVGRYLAPQLGSAGHFNGSALLPHEDPLSRRVRALHAEVVGALGLQQGVTHLEVYVAADELVVGEVACRPAGGGIADAVLRQHGVDLWDVFVRTSLGLAPSAVLPGRARGTRAAVLLLPLAPGQVRRIDGLDELARLPGVADVLPQVRVGDAVSARMHSATASCVVHLDSPDSATLDALVRQVLEVYSIDVAPC